MKLPELPSGWYWEKVVEWNWKNWGLEILFERDFGGGFRSITTHIGPYVRAYKTRKEED